MIKKDNEYLWCCHLHTTYDIMTCSFKRVILIVYTWFSKVHHCCPCCSNYCTRSTARYRRTGIDSTLPVGCHKELKKKCIYVPYNFLLTVIAIQRLNYFTKEFFLKFHLKLNAKKKKGQKKWIKRRREERRQKVNSSTRLRCHLNETRTVSICLENFAIAHAWTLKAGSTEGREVLNL